MEDLKNIGDYKCDNCGSVIKGFKVIKDGKYIASYICKCGTGGHSTGDSFLKALSNLLIDLRS